MLKAAPRVAMANGFALLCFGEKGRRAKRTATTKMVLEDGMQYKDSPVGSGQWPVLKCSQVSPARTTRSKNVFKTGTAKFFQRFLNRKKVRDHLKKSVQPLSNRPNKCCACQFHESD